MVIEWEEIYLEAEPVSSVETASQNPQNTILFTNDDEFLSLKSNLQQSLEPIWDFKFYPEEFLETDLLGKIHLSSGTDLPLMDSKSISILFNRIDDIIKYYERNFKKDDDVLIWITYILLKNKKITETLNFIQVYHTNVSLPLELEIFLILGGVYSTKLPNIILSGKEENLVNILYKYKFLEISKYEKNSLYDAVLSGNYPNFLGIVFQLFYETYKGIRNIYPIYEIILSQLDKYSIEEQKEFLESYKETGNYFTIYKIYKKVYNKKEVSEWLNKIKYYNGKNIKLRKKMDEDPSFNIFNEVNTPGNDELIYLLTPFEIIEILKNPEMEANYKKKVFILYEKNTFSYFTNLNIAILYFYLKDYSKFLLYLERSGSLKNMSEILYLKSICFLEVGYHKEAKKILSILNSKFPSNKEVEEKLTKII
jgi:hypothetical protein